MDLILANNTIQHIGPDKKYGLAKLSMERVNLDLGVAELNRHNEVGPSVGL